MPAELLVAIGGLLSSFLSGLVGVGGAIVLTPVLLYAPALVGTAALPVKIVTGLSVVQAISGSAIGSLRHQRYGNVSADLVKVMGPAAAAASLVGALVSGAAPDRLLVGIFAAFALLGAVALVLPAPGGARRRGDRSVDPRAAAAVATFIGFFGGMVGIAAVAFIIAALVYLLRVPPRTAIGTSLGIGVFSAVAALVGKAATAQIDPLLGAIVFVGAVVSSPIGAAIGQRTPSHALVRLLACVVFLTGLRMAWHAATGA